MSNKDKLIIFGICLAVILFSLFLLYKNPDCPFHVDYVQYTKEIKNFYERQVIGSGVNGKYIYVYLMSVFLAPFKLLGFNIYDSMAFITGIFQALLIYLLYKYTNSLLKTILAASTLTFLTLIGNAETAIIASVFLMLYFINRDKPYSEFFIAIASFIRIDSAIYYLFAKKWTALIPMSITFLQWLNQKQFVNSDFGLNNHPLSVLFVVIASYGAVLIPLIYLIKFKDKLDFITHLLIFGVFILLLESPSQKLFFFPVLLSFMLYDFEFEKLKKYALVAFIIFNLLLGFAIQVARAEHCTPKAIYGFAQRHNESTYYGVFQPYLDYYNKTYAEPYAYELSQNCKNATDYFIAEDWRNSQILYWPYKFCLEEYNG